MKVYDKKVYLKQAEYVRTEILLISQEKMAQKIGISHMTYSRWINGKVTPNYESIQKVANFCDDYDVPPPEALKNRDLPFGNIQTIRTQREKGMSTDNRADQEEKRNGT